MKFFNVLDSHTVWKVLKFGDCFGSYFSVLGLNSFLTQCFFPIPSEIVRNPKPARHFQGVQKRNIRLKWVNTAICRVNLRIQFKNRKICTRKKLVGTPTAHIHFSCSAWNHSICICLNIQWLLLQLFS